MATFTQDEIDFLRSHGNELCAKTWLGLWDPKRAAHQQEQRELMMDKYERKRYYLEPASPLKSLANAVNLKSSVPVTNHIQNGQHHNGYASIHLTPPAAQRTSANGLQKMANNSSSNSSSGNSSSSISRPHHHHHNHNHHNNSSSQNNNHDAFGLGGGLSSLNSAGSTSTGALSDTSSCASNGFGADSDFVADFGSANIFDATSAARSTGSPAVSSVSSVGSSNGYAKVQPLRAAHLQQQQQQLQMQQQQQLLNGNGHQGGAENFADFDHAPIFNAVAPPTFHDWISDWSRRGFHDPFDDCDESPPTPNPPFPAQVSAAVSSPPLPTVKEEPEELAWNFWQEEMLIEEGHHQDQQSLFHGTTPFSPSNPFLTYSSNEEHHLPAPSPPEKPSYSYLLFSSISNSSLEEEVQADDQEMNILNANFHDFFTWSAPLQNGHATSPPKGGSAAMAPSEDRYAALKDLDEQLRELKASETATEAPTPTNGNGQATDAFGGALNNNPNPFKGQPQQQQQLSSHMVNPFQQQQQQQHLHQNLYGQLTLIPNAYGSSPQQQMGHHLLQQQQQLQQHQQQQSFFNFNNNNGFTISQGLPNGCGFGSMQPAPVMANNPFAASGAMNTNNPFL
ncbi:alpha-protein kinase 1 isoform X2 [Drosophila takahashii]